MTQKNKILLVTGIADTYFSNSSDKKLDYGQELVSKVKDYINVIGNTSVYNCIVNLTNTYDTVKDINVVSNVNNKNKLVHYKMFNPSLFDTWNSFSLLENKTETQEYNAKAFDYIFPSKDYEIHICGVDINGFYKDIIKELIKKGYTVYLYSDLIKRFKNTEAGISSIKNKNFIYCSYKSVRLK